MRQYLQLHLNHYRRKVYQCYPAIFLSRQPVFRKGMRIIPITSAIDDIVPDPFQLNAYEYVCQFKCTEALPVTFPYVLSTPLHLKMIADPSFPLSLMRMVNVKQSIVQIAPIPRRAKLNLTSRIDDFKQMRGGIEFNIITRVRCQGRVVWEGVLTILCRPVDAPAASLPDNKDRKKSKQLPPAQKTGTFYIPAQTGRQYALVSGDFNPIHLHPKGAQWFGFPKAIVHGAWSLARCVAEFPSLVSEYPFVLKTRFRSPIYLPADVMLRVREEGRKSLYDLRSPDGARIYLSGSVEKGEGQLDQHIT